MVAVRAALRMGSNLGHDARLVALGGGHVAHLMAAGVAAHPRNPDEGATGILSMIEDKCGATSDRRGCTV